MAVIYGFSAQNASQSKELSGETLEVIIEIIEPIAEDVDVENMHFSLRKYAHIFLYFALGLFVFPALYLSGVRKWTVVLTVLICFSYGITDEIHQMFVPGRGPLFTDTLIDGAGALAASMLLTIFLWTRKKIKDRKKNMDRKKKEILDD